MDRQTDRQTGRTKNITSFFGGGNECVHTHTHTQAERQAKVKTVYLPVSLRSLGGYNYSMTARNITEVN